MSVPCARGDPHLAPIFVLTGSDEALPRDHILRLDEPLAGEDNGHGHGQIVQHAVREVGIKAAPDREDGAIRAQHIAGARFLVLQLLLDPPVERTDRSGRAAFRADIMERTQHAAHLRVGIARQQIVDRVRIQQHIGVGEDQHVATRPRRQLLHAMRLTAAAGATDQRHEAALRGDQVACTVRRSIVEGEDFQRGMPRLQHRQIGQLLRYRRCFIIGAEQQRGARHRSFDRRFGPCR